MVRKLAGQNKVLVSHETCPHVSVFSPSSAPLHCGGRMVEGEASLRPFRVFTVNKFYKNKVKKNSKFVYHEEKQSDPIRMDFSVKSHRWSPRAAFVKHFLQPRQPPSAQRAARVRKLQRLSQPTSSWATMFSFQILNNYGTRGPMESRQPGSHPSPP